jgi:glycosyltransferase involved in cell wall biosynthesis
MKKILIISPVHTCPLYAGNSERIYQFLLALEDLGYDVYFFHISSSQLFGKYDELGMKAQWENYISFPYTYPRSILKVGLRIILNRFIRKLTTLLKLRYRPIFFIDEWYDDNVNQLLQKIANQEKFDAVIAEYVFFSKALENFDVSTLKIIDTHDVFTDRQKLYQANKEKPDFFYTDSFNEKKGLERADRIIAIQDHEKIFFQEQLGLKNKVYTIGHFIELDNLFNPSVENDIVFFGSASPVNIKSVKFFLEEVFPKVKQEISNVNFLIGGSICDCIEDNKNYQKLGKVENKKLIYKQASIMVNPMLFGTGIKIKNVESLGYGIPLITTSIGAEGLEEKANAAFLVADNAQEFALKVILILSDRQLRLNLSKSAFQFAQEINEKNINNLKLLLDLG